MGGFIKLLGQLTLGFFRWLGQLTDLVIEMGTAIVRGRPRFNLTGHQIVSVGFGSQLVVIVTGAFTGAVFAAQSYFKFSDLGLASGVGPVVSIALCRELGPVLTGLMVSGRVGAAMAAEIGTMKVTEQVDALRSMGVHPVDYLVIPRAIGLMFSMPLLVAEAIGFGLLASHVLIVWHFNVPSTWYDYHVVANTALEDIAIGMIKGFVFGALIVVISCHQGLKATNGAVGVGRGTTAAVVQSSLAILITNMFLSFLLNYFFPLGSGNY
ncbi:MAG: ABC transporter permease [Verrucomicrobiales bacterium]|nr:ABC transporter permease [Verrucomicrobiales bacterium]